MVYVFLAEGFEEIEALAPVDVLRRAGIETLTVGIGGPVIRGGHGIDVTADIMPEQVKTENIEAIVLPGGGLGTENLEKSAFVQNMITECMAKNSLIAAICAAPSILGHRGILKGKQATAYPGFDEELEGAIRSDDYVCQDGNIITARGMGVSLDFGFAIIKALRSAEEADAIRRQVQCQV